MLQLRYKMLAGWLAFAAVLAVAAAAQAPPRLQSIAEKGPTKQMVIRRLYAYLANNQCSAQIAYPAVLKCLPIKLRVVVRDYKTFPDIEISRSLHSAIVRRGSCNGRALVDVYYYCNSLNDADVSQNNQVGDEIEDENIQIEDGNSQIKEEYEYDEEEGHNVQLEDQDDRIEESSDGSDASVESQSGRNWRQIGDWNALPPIIPPIRKLRPVAYRHKRSISKLRPVSYRHKRSISMKKRILLPEPDSSVV